MAAIKKEVFEGSLQSEAEGCQILFIKEENLEEDYQDHGKHPEEQLQTFLIKEENDSKDCIEDNLANLQTTCQSSQLRDASPNKEASTCSQNTPTTHQIPEPTGSHGHERHQPELKTKLDGSQSQTNMAAIKKEVFEESLQYEGEGCQIIFIKGENLENDDRDHDKAIEHPEEQLQTYFMKEEDDSYERREEDSLAYLHTIPQSSKLQDADLNQEMTSQRTLTKCLIPELSASYGHERHQTEWKTKLDGYQSQTNMAAIKKEVFEESLQYEEEGCQIIFIQGENLENDDRDHDKAIEHPEEQLQTYFMKKEDDFDERREEDSLAYLQTIPQSSKLQDADLNRGMTNQRTRTINLIPEFSASHGHERHQTELKVNDHLLKKRISGNPSTADSATVSAQRETYILKKIEEHDIVGNNDGDWGCDQQKNETFYMPEEVNYSGPSSVSSSETNIEHAEIPIIQEKQLQCPFCNNQFPDSASLLVHERTHTGEKPYECSLCTMRFIQSSTLTRHMRSHKGELPYQCFSCKRGFAHSIDLGKHKTCTGGKFYQCSVCKKRFGQSSNLITHMRTHTGEKPYKCSLCKKVFASSSHRTIHMRIHTGEKPFECSLCEKAFATNSHRSYHMKSHTGEKTI